MNLLINHAYHEYKHSLTFRVRRYVVIAMKPVHRLQICPIVHNYRASPTIPPSYIRICAVVWECGKGETHRRAWPIYILPRLRLTRNVMTLLSTTTYKKYSFTHSLPLWTLHNKFPPFRTVHSLVVTSNSLFLQLQPQSKFSLAFL